MADERRRKAARMLLRRRRSGEPEAVPDNMRPKLGEAVLSDLLANFGDGGIDAIEKLRCERPDDYFRVVAEVLRMELPGVDVRPIVPRIRRLFVRPGD